MGEKPNGAGGSRSRRVMESRARAQRERAAMAADFRVRLTRELVSDGSIAQEVLIQSAASAATEIFVLSAKFLRCAATAAELDRLGRARSELNRTLRLLGVAPRSAAEPNTGPKLETWLIDWRTRQKPQDEAVTTDFEASGEESEP
jgi:hypothetical protein